MRNALDRSYRDRLLTPKGKTNPLGKVKTDRRKYLERAEIYGLSDIYLTPIILNQVLLYFVRELPPKFQHQYQLHAFFFLRYTLI